MYKKIVGIILAIILLSTGLVVNADLENPEPSILLGDVTLNGTVSSLDVSYVFQYLSGIRELDEQQLTNADVTLNGKVTKEDAYLIQAAAIRSITLPAKYGDVTGDLTISGLDVYYVSRYIAGLETFTKQQRVLADVNRDGKINQTDVNLILKASVRMIELPFIK